jgi:enoyl-CoA hydratase
LTSGSSFQIDEDQGLQILRLRSDDGTNLLTRECVVRLTEAVRQMSRAPQPLVIAGNDKFFSAGADLAEISTLNGPSAYEFSKMGQRLMQLVDEFPAPVFGAISGYCMGAGSTWRWHAIIGSHRRMRFSDTAAQPWD